MSTLVNVPGPALQRGIGVVAPFDYSSMLWALLLGYWLFGELPDTLVYVGAGIVAGAGLYVIWRERQLGLKRAREAEGPP